MLCSPPHYWRWAAWRWPRNRVRCPNPAPPWPSPGTAPPADTTTGDDPACRKSRPQYSRKDHPDTSNPAAVQRQRRRGDGGRLRAGQQGPLHSRHSRRTKFRVLEDNVPQRIQTINPGEAPMTIGHGDRVQRPLPAAVFHELVPDPATGLGVRPARSSRRITWPSSPTT